MKWYYGVLVAVAAVMVAAYIGSILGAGECAPEQCPGPDRETLFQVSTIGALMDGVYDGSYSFGDLGDQGDLGLGTFDALDGEMVALDGVFYQAKADGTIVIVDGTQTTPFAIVTFFEPDLTLTPGHQENVTTLGAFIEENLPVTNHFWAVKISGPVPYIKVRSVPAQQPPYPTLVDAVKEQAVFEFRGMNGTVVGFYTPAFMEGLNVPGFHLHFISADGSAGGHVLDLSLDNATVELDETPGFRMQLPESGEFLRMNLQGGDSGDIDKVEK